MLLDSLTEAIESLIQKTLDHQMENGINEPIIFAFPLIEPGELTLHLKVMLSHIEYQYLDAFGGAGPGKQIKANVSLGQLPEALLGETSEVVPRQVLLSAPDGILGKEWA